ncbi:MLP-like protein 34 [Rosa rugosa]|uniref:MLP-like protein 34 n=1 Tax=Rosa rugosa TaxID=74645 RepID=UPI002B417394|nr:MLP-like protein 34 [Rosa rugosa]
MGFGLQINRARTSEDQAEIKLAADKFYGFFKNKISSFFQMFPQILKSFEVVGEGEIRIGSVTKWAFNILFLPDLNCFKSENLTKSMLLVNPTSSPCCLAPGVETTKLKIQEADDENTTITFIGLEGDILKGYKSFKEKLQVIKAANGGSIVKWTFECEKANANANAPDAKIGMRTFQLKL